MGPGEPLFLSCLDAMQMDTERLEDWAPIYNPGDFWFQSIGTAESGGFTALSYYNSMEGRASIHTLDTTMTDLFTPRGTRVGDSRETVLAAYPEALTGNYHNKYPDEPDMLSFLPRSGHNPSQTSDLSQLDFSSTLGPAILFFFDESGQTVERIVLTVTDN